MSALPYQPVPTASQQRELERWVQRHYPVSQYASNQPSMADHVMTGTVDDELDRIAAELDADEGQPEPCQFCAIPTPGEEGEPQVMAWVGSTPVLIIVALACVAWVAYFWSAV